MANLPQGSSMAPDTVFWLLSMTKAITATACMQLIEQGRLRLDQKASDIVPELASPQVLEGFEADGKPRLRPAKRPITVRHLLTHTSGYTYSNWSETLTRYEQVTGLADIATARNAAFEAPLEFDPGDRWEYGISIDWVGKLVEAVSDQSLEIYFRENIFQPLGMEDSGFLIGSEQKRRVATLFNRQPDGTLAAAPFEMPQRPEFFTGGAGAFSTPQDYMKLLQALLNGGSFAGARMILVRHQRGFGPERAQRRERLLGWAPQLLLLDRSGEESDRRNVHAAFAVLRCPRRFALWHVRTRAVSWARANMILRAPSALIESGVRRSACTAKSPLRRLQGSSSESVWAAMFSQARCLRP
jgi:CubicO group peptidase (beta-lactamase class C family)